MAIQIGELVIDLKADIARLQRDMDGAKSVVTQRMRDIEGAAAAARNALGAIGISLSAGALTAFVANVVKADAALDDMAETTGATVEGLSRIQQVALKTGQDFGTVEGALVKLNRTLSPFNAESNAAALALKAIGLSIDDVRRMAPDQAFEQIARSLNQFEDGAGKTQVALALLGKTGAEYLPLLKELAEDQETVAQVTAQQAAEAEKLEKAWANLTTTARNFAEGIARYVIPALNQLAAAMKAGGFGGGLAAGITSAFSDNLGQNIALAQQRLDKLQHDRSRNNIMQGGLIGGVVGISESQIINTIDALKALQREQALAIGEGAYSNEGRGVDTPRKKQIDAIGIAAEAEEKKVKAAKIAADNYIADVFGAAGKDLGSMFEKRAEQLDQFGFAGSDSYMRFLKDNLAFERSAWSDLARDREEDERDRARAARQAADDAAREWKRQSDEIERSLTDALLRGFESGSDFGKNFVDTVKNLFNTLVLRRVISAIVQDVAGAVTGVLGGMGIPGYANAGGFGLSDASSLYSIGSGLFGGGFSGTAAAGTLAGIGGSIGGTFGAGISAGSTLGFFGGMSQAGMLAEAGSYSAAGGAALGAMGAAAPYIAAAVALYSAFAKEGGGPKSEMRGGALLADTPGRYSSNAGLDAMVDALKRDYAQIASSFGGVARTDIQAMIRTALDPQGDAPNQMMAVLTAGASPQYWKYQETGRGEEAMQQWFADQLPRMLVASLKATDLDDTIDAMLAGIDPMTASASQLSAALSTAREAMADTAKATEEMQKATQDAQKATQDALRKMLADSRKVLTDWSAAARSVIGTRIDIAGGELSALDPQEKLSLAASGFKDISRRAALGDLSAFEGLGSAATDYLGAARGYYASGPGYASIYEEVQTALERAQNLAVRQVNLAGGFSDLLTETAAGNAANEAGIEMMIAQLKQINARLAAIESGGDLAASAPGGAGGGTNYPAWNPSSSPAAISTTVPWSLRVFRL